MDAGETTIYYAFIIAAITIGSILGYFLYYLVKLHRRYLHLHQSRNEIQLQLIEKERRRIAADLHDELGPLLSATTFKINEVESTSAEGKLLLQQATDHLNQVMIRIRRISNNLVPYTLLRYGPIKAIEEYIATVNNRFPLQIILQVNKVPVLNTEMGVQLYRILQEVIHNTVKHAVAERLTINFYSRNNLLYIHCSDNGRGFVTKKITQNQEGLGLQNMLLRTTMLGGEMFLETKPGKGTSITFEIPHSAIKLNQQG